MHTAQPVGDPAQPVVGMVGGGQLARMSWQAAIGLGIDLRVLAARSDDSAARVMPTVEVGDPGDPDDLSAFADSCDIVTLDHELVDLPTLRRLADRGAAVRPSPGALRFAQNKIFQRRRFAEAGLPVPAHTTAASRDDVAKFAASSGWPVVLKRPRGGYDGRGVWHVADEGALDAAWRQAAGDTTELLAEEAVPIEREVAVLVARRPGGASCSAPVVETVQRDGMLRDLVVPARVPPPVAAEALALAARVVALVDAVGICAVELFWTGTRLLVNEIAARPHNSGHWTIDAATTSQFENHLRAVCDWPLGSMEATRPAVCTVNVLGVAGLDPRSRLPAALGDPDVHVHLYGKRPRPGRKLGHVTAAGATVELARTRAHRAAAVLMDRVDDHA